MFHTLKQLGNSLRSAATAPRAARPGMPSATLSGARPGSNATATAGNPTPQRQQGRPAAPRRAHAEPALPTIDESPYEGGPLASLGQHYDAMRLQLGKANGQAQGALTSPKQPLFASSKQTKAILENKRGELQEHANALKHLLNESESATLDRNTVTQLASHPEVPWDQVVHLRSNIDQTMLLRHRTRQTLSKVEKWIADLDKKLGGPVQTAKPSTLGELMHHARPTGLTRTHMGEPHVRFSETVTTRDNKGIYRRESLSSKPDGNQATDVPRALDPVRSSMSMTQREIGINKLAEKLRKLAASYATGTFEPMLNEGKIPAAILKDANRYGITRDDHAAIIERYQEFAALQAEEEEEEEGEAAAASESGSASKSESAADEIRSDG